MEANLEPVVYMVQRGAEELWRDYSPYTGCWTTETADAKKWKTLRGAERHALKYQAISEERLRVVSLPVAA